MEVWGKLKMLHGYYSKIGSLFSTVIIVTVILVRFIFCFYMPIEVI